MIVVKIFVDENMFYVCELFSCLGEVKVVLGCLIFVEELNYVDVLMVCLVMKVNELLLSGMLINFVGIVMVGIDYVDEVWLKQVGIGFLVVFGCNVIVVVEYVFFVLLMLVECDGFLLCDCIIGIVGVGNVGSWLQIRFEVLGICMLLCDLLCVVCGDEGDFCMLDELVQEVDVLIFYMLFYKDGLYKMLYLVDEMLIC